MKYLITLLLLVFFLLNGQSQKIKQITHREISVLKNDSTIKANYLLANKKLALRESITYYWYANNSIKVNQGGYKGKLLDGLYQITDLNGNLLLKGKFKLGTKSGQWKRWNKKGDLIEVSHWKNGYKNGKTRNFETRKLVKEQSYKRGKLNGACKKLKNDTVIEKSNFKNGLLHGKLITYQSDTIQEEVLYKKGKLLVKPEKKEPSDKISKTDDNDKKDQKKRWKFWQKENKTKESKKVEVESKKQSTEDKSQKKKKEISGKRKDKRLNKEKDD